MSLLLSWRFSEIIWSIITVSYWWRVNSNSITKHWWTMAATFDHHRFDYKLDITKHCRIILRYILSIPGSCRNTDFVILCCRCYCFTFLICDSIQKHFLVALPTAVASMTQYKLRVNFEYLFQMTFESKEARSIPGTPYLECIQLIHRVWALKQPTHSVWYSWKGVNCNSRFRQLSVQESTKTSACETFGRLITAHAQLHSRAIDSRLNSEPGS